MKRFLLLALSILASACTVNGPEGPQITVTVETLNATDISFTYATLHGRYADAGSTGVYDYGFYYGTDRSNLKFIQPLNSSPYPEASFSATLTSLEPGTTYFYKAFVTVYDAKSGMYIDRLGEMETFITSAEPEPEPEPEPDPDPQPAGLQYLGCYEMPFIELRKTDSCSDNGPEKYGSTSWYGYLTQNPDRKVATHTYSYEGRQYRNYTCMIDRTKKAPVWSAFVMHKGAYPDNNVGRTGSWKEDPAFPSSWQQESSANGYSRGHLVASNYRQACSDANKQTFYCTNQALQEQNGFNGAVWNNLELAVAANAPSGRDTLYVVVGLLFEDGVPLPSFSTPCPSHFYKLLMKCSFNAKGEMEDAEGCAYLFTNVSHKGEPYSDFVTSIDAIEQRTGIDFYHNVPKALQDQAEKTAVSLL